MAAMDAPAPATSLEVRARLVEALKLALVGPGGGHALAEERLPGWERPSNWYLTGFLIPSGTCQFLALAAVRLSEASVSGRGQGTSGSRRTRTRFT